MPRVAQLSVVGVLAVDDLQGQVHRALPQFLMGDVGEHCRAATESVDGDDRADPLVGGRVVTGEQPLCVGGQFGDPPFGIDAVQAGRVADQGQEEPPMAVVEVEKALEELASGTERSASSRKASMASLAGCTRLAIRSRAPTTRVQISAKIARSRTGSGSPTSSRYRSPKRLRSHECLTPADVVRNGPGGNQGNRMPCRVDGQIGVGRSSWGCSVLGRQRRTAQCHETVGWQPSRGASWA